MAFPAPVFPNVRPDVAVKRGVDLAAVHKLSQIFKRMDLPPLEIRRIHHSFPVLVGETRRPDKNIHNLFNNLARLPDLRRLTSRGSPG